MTAPKRMEEWVKFHIHMLLTCRIYLNHDSDCDRFAYYQLLVRSFFGGGSFQFDIDNIGGMVLHRVALWSKNAILHYVICERPQSDFESLHNLAEKYLEPVREANKTSNLSVQLEAIYTRRWIPYDALSSIILCQRHSGSCATLAA